MARSGGKGCYTEGQKSRTGVRRTQEAEKAEADRWIQIMQVAKNQEKDIVFLVYSQAGYTRGTQQRLVENGAFIVSWPTRFCPSFPHPFPTTL